MFSRKVQLILGFIFTILYPLVGLWVLTSDRFSFIDPQWLRKTFGIACIILGVVRAIRLYKIWNDADISQL